MVIVNKNSTNTLVFTLTERSQLPNPYYLFVFTSDTGETYYFNMTDSSGYPRRFNEMTLVESDTSPNPAAGRLELDYGWGTYEVYESATQTLDPADTTGRVLERGKYYVDGYPATMDSNNSTNIYL